MIARVGPIESASFYIYIRWLHYIYVQACGCDSLSRYTIYHHEIFILLL